MSVAEAAETEPLSARAARSYTTDPEGAQTHVLTGKLALSGVLGSIAAFLKSCFPLREAANLSSLVLVFP